MSVFGKLFGAAVDTAILPFSAAKDVLTLGGSMSGDRESATGRRLKRIADKVESAADEAAEDDD